MTGIEKRHFHLLKRFVDIAFSASLIIISLPFAILISVLIKLDSSGPILFTQDRVSARPRFNGSSPCWDVFVFRLYKFRTMAKNVEQKTHEDYIKAYVRGQIEASDDDSATFKLTGDSRITRIGRLLRRTSLDELPQFINVLKGHMSLVGPRPVPVYEVEAYNTQHFLRLAAVPGITGLWQVCGRGRVTFEEMVQMDLEYIRNRSLKNDLKVLLMTIPAVFGAAGAK